MNVMMVRICSLLWRMVKYQLASKKRSKHAARRSAFDTFSYCVSMTAPVCCVCLQVLAVCSRICARNVSLYRRTHVHPYLPGHTHQLVSIHVHMYT